MPVRMLDFDALWASDKLARCACWAQAEYSWLYGLADANGAFEITNLRVIWGKVAAIRKDLSIERLEQIFDEFRDKGLLFVWERDGKKFGFWTGSDKPGRLPSKSIRERYSRLAPPVPEKQLKAYLDSIKTQSRLYPDRIGLDWVGLKLVKETICANPSGSHEAVFPSEQTNLADRDAVAESTSAELPPVSSETNSGAEQEAAIRRVWDYYLEKFGKNPKLLSFTTLRQQKGLARLRESLKKTGGDLQKAEGLLKVAADALAGSDFHCGVNDRKRKFDSWEKNLFKSQDQFEHWLEQT